MATGEFGSWKYFLKQFPITPDDYVSIFVLEEVELRSLTRRMYVRDELKSLRKLREIAIIMYMCI